MTEKDVLDALRDVVHPAKGNKDIVSLGMAGEILVEDGGITVTLLFPGRRDPLTEYLTGSTRAAIIRRFPDVPAEKVEVRAVVAEAERPSPQEKKAAGGLTLDELSNVAHIVGIASGKGGVGKSTVAVNLAVTLARKGYRVGLADADIYGPSVPIMTGTEGEVPEILVADDGRELMLPIEKFGVKWMSIGFFTDRERALAWRGPMACNALKQMILQVRWGVLDFLLIDMPPGTGDIHLSLMQDIPLEGAVIVTTPQGVSLADASKGADLIQNENIGRKLFGVVENMSWFTPAELPDNKYYIFGKGGGAALAGHRGVPLLAQIPLVHGIMEGADSGLPSCMVGKAESEAFSSLAEAFLSAVSGQ